VLLASDDATLAAGSPRPRSALWVVAQATPLIIIVAIRKFRIVSLLVRKVR